MKKKILITGSGGFIGRNIMESFLTDKYDFTVLKSSQVNLLEEGAVNNFFKGRYFDALLHVACKPGHRNACDGTNIFYSNVRIFENLARHAGKIGRFINFGSGAIYDNSQDVRQAREEDAFLHIPQDEHGFCKYVVQKRILTLGDFVDLNIFGIFGKYEDWEIRFISNCIAKTLFDMPPTLRQDRIFSYLFVEDLPPILDFFISAPTLKHKAYNITPEGEVSLKEAAKTVLKISGKDLELKVAQEGFGPAYSGSNARLKGDFGEVKFTPFAAAVGKLYNWYRENKNMLDKELLEYNK